jgi:hypothetical protein
MKKIIYILIILILSFIATAVSIKYERFHPGVTGNGCDTPRGLCYEDLPAGGFPFTYIYDRGDVSVIGKLGLEDNFYTGWFIADVTSYFITFFLIGLLIRKKSFSAIA